MPVFAYVWLTLLTLGMVAVFAMISELAVRREDQISRQVDSIQAVDGFKIRQVEAPEFANIACEGRAYVMVLSTSCQACSSLVSDRRALNSFLHQHNASLVIVAPSQHDAETFLDGRDATYVIDIGGDWTRSRIGIESSPCFVLIEDGVATNAFLFSSLNALRPVLAGGSSD